MDFAQELKSRVDIVSVIGERVRLKKAGPTVTRVCARSTPKRRRPSTVSSAKQFYYCFGCQAGGDVFKFVMEIEGITFYEALKELAERNGIPMPKRAQYADDESRLREALFQMHEIAADIFAPICTARRARRRARIWFAAASRRRRSSNSGWDTPTAPAARSCACSNSAISPPRRLKNRAWCASAMTAASTTISAAG